MDPLDKAADVFQRHFGSRPNRLFQAPGRVNLIGEHTDYNDGFVLPCAIDFRTVLAAGDRDDAEIHVIAADCQEQRDQIRLLQTIEAHHEYQWADYIRGTVKQILERGHQLRGMNMVISGNIPQGAGLSSSASLEVVVATACSELNDHRLSATETAHIGQAAENQFVGTNCGIMDQLASAAGLSGHALLIDCRSLEFEPIPVPEDIAIMIIDSNISRGLVSSEYNNRRRQCELAARQLGLVALRDMDPQQFQSRQSQLDAVVARRARHVITENERTQAAARALAAADLPALGRLMASSHASMRDDFEITVPAIDQLVDIVQAVLGDQGGARMTGGGFGGCVVAITEEAMAPAVAAAVADKYPQRTGLHAAVHVCKASAGAGIVRRKMHETRQD